MSYQKAVGEDRHHRTRAVKDTRQATHQVGTHRVGTQAQATHIKITVIQVDPQEWELELLWLLVLLPVLWSDQLHHQAMEVAIISNPTITQKLAKPTIRSPLTTTAKVASAV